MLNPLVPWARCQPLVDSPLVGEMPGRAEGGNRNEQAR